jgi:hypothetical protein
MWFSGIGVLTCLCSITLGVTHIYELSVKNSQSFIVCIAVTWFASLKQIGRLTKDVRPKEFWRVVLRGCPSWMRIGLLLVLGSVVAAFMWVSLASVRSGDSSYRFPLFALFFFAPSFCVAYSAINLDRDETTRCCINGHSILPQRNFCDECGGPAAPKTDAVSSDADYAISFKKSP